MTITISVDTASIRHDLDRHGVDFEYSDGAARHRVHVPDKVIADHLRVGRLPGTGAESYVRRVALQIAMLLAGRSFARSLEGDILVDSETLRKVR